jgi:beta-1,4-mannosyl-glycoprotein beta-1,4-N-acetylglucosaminyltransferase
MNDPTTPLHRGRRDYRIYDCFIFYDEFEMLDIRLHELDPVVDVFVLAEATHDFKGRPKPLFFDMLKSRYDCFLPRIRHVIVDDCPIQTLIDPSLWRDECYKENWDNEVYQRQCLLRALTDCSDDDLILVSDVDEIPRREILKDIPRDGERHGLELRNYHYNFNLVDLELPRGGVGQDIGTITWGGMALPTGELAHPQWIHQFEIPHKIPNAGWHFTWFGGEERARQKELWYSHPAYGDRSEQLSRNQRRPLTYVDDISDLPRYVLDNISRFRHHFDPRWLQTDGGRFILQAV